MYRFAQVTTGAAFLLVIAGGLVTSTGSGLAVPDWPLSYGTLFPPMVGGIRYEHTHRMIAAGVGLLILLLAAWVQAAEQRRWVRRLAWGCFALVVAQGLLGGATVLLQLPAAVSVSHAMLGQITFAALAVLTRVLSPTWRNGTVTHPSQSARHFVTPRASAQAPALFRLSVATTGLLLAQLLLGAAMRHAGWRPALLAAHLAGAAATLTLMPLTVHAVLRRYRTLSLFSRPARAISWLLLAQIGLGITTYLSGRAVIPATAHVAAGALLLATSAALSVSVFYFLAHPVSFPRKREPDPRFREDDVFKSALRVYLELTKPQLTFLAVVTSLIGYLLGGNDVGSLLMLILGTVLVGAGAAALNQYLEREADGRMERTKGRPLPSGRLQPDSALAFGVFTAAAGLLTLLLGTNPLAAALAALTLAVYLFAYTPLKSRSALCTLVGAIPGALPPLIGWAAAAGRLPAGAWLLFSILFLWQLPHFLAIAWTWREDYARAGFKMLPVIDPEGGATARQIVLYCLALVPVTLLPAASGSQGFLYLSVAFVGGLAFLGCGLAAAWARSRASARRLFLASILYLPVLLTTMTLDRMLLS